ncbi:MAG TPA: hypothetical protein V6C88_04215 [Chroococcidiopsis sp.]
MQSSPETTLRASSDQRSDRRTDQRSNRRTDSRTNKRILVLGAEPSAGATAAYSWSNLPARLNVADFDVVILNLVPFLSHSRDRDIQPERLPAWQQLARLLFSQGSEILCIGIPGVENHHSLYQSTLWWLPVVPDFVVNSGESIQDVKSEFAFYFRYVRRWYFSINPTFKEHFLGLGRYLQAIHPQANHLKVGMGAIARNRLQQAIAFKMMFRANVHQPQAALYSSGDRPSPADPAAQINSGTVIWLPPPTEISAEEAVNLLLSHRYGQAAADILPPWIEAYKLPQQRQLEDEIQRHQEAIEHLNQAIATAQQQLDQVSRFNQLLTAHHPPTLSVWVSMALHYLGATVSAAPMAGPGAIALTSPSGQQAIVVVRARPGDLKGDDLLQLEQAVHGQTDPSPSPEPQLAAPLKGILIANTHYHQPPSQRDPSFAPRHMLVAQRLGYCLLSTSQLFQAIASYQQQQLDLDHFWQTLFTTDGRCDLPSFQPPSV